MRCRCRMFSSPVTYCDSPACVAMKPSRLWPRWPTVIGRATGRAADRQIEIDQRMRRVVGWAAARSSRTPGASRRPRHGCRARHDPQLGRVALRWNRRREIDRLVELGRTVRFVGRAKHNRPRIIRCGRFYQSACECRSTGGGSAAARHRVSARIWRYSVSGGHGFERYASQPALNAASRASVTAETTTTGMSTVTLDSRTCLQHGPSVDARHREVEHDHVGAKLGDLVEPHPAVDGREHRPALGAEELGIDVARVNVVFNDEHREGLGGGRPREHG